MTHQLNPDWRNKRNQHLNNYHKNLGPMHYSIASYCTETQHATMDKKPMMFTPELCLDPVRLLSNPLQKNLGDTLPSSEPKKAGIQKISAQSFNLRDSVDSLANNVVIDKETPNSALSSIGNFISGMFNVISTVMPAMPFQRRARSSDCFYDSTDSNFKANARDSPPPEPWLPAKSEPQNKNNCNDQSDVLARENHINVGEKTEMSVDCRAAAAHCEAKLNKVRNLLVQPDKKATPRLITRRPKKVFVEPNSIKDSCEETVCDNIDHLPNDTHVECVSLCNNTESELVQIDSPLTKTVMAPLECLDIVKTIAEEKNKIPEAAEDKETDVPVISDKLDACPLPKPDTAETNNTTEDLDPKIQIIQSCEDKVSKLKALLQQRRKNNAKTCKSAAEPKESVTEDEKNATDKVRDKRSKTPKRLSVDKRKKCQLQKHIEEDMNFGNGIDLEPSSVESSPSINKKHVSEASLNESSENLSSGSDCYFNEIAGRFRNSSTTESEDSFQIVFTDEPQPSPRSRKSSDCESEDSFIVFEDSPDNCYTTTDVFGDQPSDESDDELSDDDDGHGMLASSLSRTIGDLTDDSLYEDGAVVQSVPYSDSEDEVDCGTRADEEDQDTGSKGLLLNAARKLAKKNQPAKKVRFSEAPPKVRVMRVWAFAARQARRGQWEQNILDRDRFKRRIADVDMAISWVLKPQHRARVKFQRFMPWWHAQRRQEAAEKKRLEAERVIREAEEKIIEEARVKREEEERVIEEARAKKEEEERVIEEARQKAEEEERRKMELIELKLNGWREKEKQVEIVIKDKFYLTPNAKCTAKQKKSAALIPVPIVHLNTFGRAKMIHMRNSQNAKLTSAQESIDVNANKTPNS